MALIVGALLVASQANADGFSAGKLLHYCGPNSPERAWCTQYIAGYIGAMGVAESTKVRDERKWCLPEGMTAEQAREIVERFLIDHPETLRNSAAFVTGAALRLAFPCEEKRL